MLTLDILDAQHASVGLNINHISCLKKRLMSYDVTLGPGSSRLWHEARLKINRTLCIRYSPFGSLRYSHYGNSRDNFVEYVG